MKQALHIFQKDVRRLWIQIALLWVAIGYFAYLDIRLQATAVGFTDSQVDTVGIKILAGAIVWVLVARAAHEESLTGENQFWVTRPYEPTRLLAAKVLLAAVVVIAPFFVADCVILGAQQMPVVGNIGGLLLRQVVTATWLILPPLAIASVTRSILEDVLAWIVCGAVADICYFPGHHSLAWESTEMYWMVVAVALMLAVVWRQYRRRGIVLSRVMMAAAVVIPALPLSAAVAIEQMRNDPATSAISIAADPSLPVTNDLACVKIPVTLRGVWPGWHFESVNQQDTFRTYDGRTITQDWNPPGHQFARLDAIHACPSRPNLEKLGPGKKVSIHSSVVFAVLAEETAMVVQIRPESFNVPNVGRCEVRTSSQKYALFCESPVWVPEPATIAMAGDEFQVVPFTRAEYPVTPFGILPGMSPLYKWVAFSFDGFIRQALETRGTIRVVLQKRIAFVRRDIDVRDAVVPEWE